MSKLGFSDIEPLLTLVEKPSRYTGGEQNMVVKNTDAMPVRFCMCFPDNYEVGMSHLGLKILYGLMNEREDTYCERCFAPWTDMEALIRERGIPLFSLETYTPLKEFDIVGFTLQYEMCYTNILNMIDLAGMPVRAADRTDGMPFVACGGPCACNPEPLAPFVDLFLIGDGEDTIPQLLECLKKWKASGLPREAFLQDAMQIEGCYVPAFYEPQYNEDGTFDRMEREEGAPEKVKRAVVEDFENTYYPTRPIVPYLAPIHDRNMLELFRGCTRGCRFCQAGFLYRPIRERSVDKLVLQASELIDNTGYEEMTLTSLSSGDYPHLSELIESLAELCAQRRVSLSLPSLRVDSFAGRYAEQLRGGRKGSLTFAPEAGTQRLRDVINKGVTQDDLIRSVSDAFYNGWNSVKLYFMIGLPTETDEDLDGIVELTKAVRDAYYQVPKEIRNKGLRIHVSASTFVPKPVTPFQWEPQIESDEVRRRQLYIKDRLKGIRGVVYSYHESKTSFLEAVFAKGDRRLADVLEEAWRSGCKFDSWSEHFQYEKWIQAFETYHLHPAWYAYRRRPLTERWPWSHIDMRIEERYLQKEYQKAMDSLVTGDCRQNCNSCFDAVSRKKYCCNAIAENQ